MATQRGNGNGNAETHPEADETGEMIDEEIIEVVDDDER